MPTVRSATSDDLPRLGRTLAAAFADDPFWQWISSPRADWQKWGAAWFAADARAQLAGHGTVLVDDEGRGAALWSPPGRWKATPREIAAISGPSLALFRGRTVRALRGLNLMEARHPVEPHWYLAILGTDPVAQGHGVGSALISAMTDRCDDEHLPAYLESSKERNVPFYARHGFEVIEELDMPDGPRCWLMWREPK